MGFRVMRSLCTLVGEARHFVFSRTTSTVTIGGDKSKQINYKRDNVETLDWHLESALVSPSLAEYGTFVTNFKLTLL